MQLGLPFCLLAAKFDTILGTEQGHHLFMNHVHFVQVPVAQMLYRIRFEMLDRRGVLGTHHLPLLPGHPHRVMTLQLFRLGR